VERRVLPATFVVQSAADDGPGSLRWALAQANADLDAGPSAILFDLPGDGLRTIRLQSPLDPIVRPVLLEGRSQPGYAGTPLIRLDGAASGPDAWNGLIVAGGGSVVAGLAVTGFSGAGIVLAGPGGSYVESNYVGLAPGDAAASPNGVGVLVLGSSSNTIGGPGAQGNVVSGNRGAGIRVQSLALGDASGNLILGNRIGTDALGASAIGNGLDGVTFVGATGGRIVENLISGNLGAGVALTGRSSGNVVLGNVVGLTADGLAVLANAKDGVLVDDSTGDRIGGLTPEEGNLISGNRGNGVRALNDASGLLIQGNRIGTDATGTLALGNQQDGVTLASSGVTVGGPSTEAGNIIAYNGVGTTGAGVQLVGRVRNDTILSNRIFANAGLGINLATGPTPNRTPGESAGPNDWMNYPILTSASADGASVSASGFLIGQASQKYTIQFFWSRAVDRSGFGEGERLLGQVEATADANGRATFNLPIGSSVEGGFLSATATDAAGNTSEFAQTILIRPYTDLSVAMAASPTVAPQGSPITYTVKVTNRGQLIAHNVAMDATLPPSATILSAASSLGTATIGPGSGVRLSVDALAPGASAVVTIVVQPAAGFSGDLRGTATARMDESESRPGDESASASARLSTIADLALAATGGAARARPGDLLSYTFTATNAGPGTVSDAVFTLPIGPGAFYVKAIGSQGAGRLEAGRLIVDLGTLAPGTSATIRVDLRAGAAGVFASTATLTTAAHDPDASNNATALSTVILGDADLRLAMQAPAVVGEGADVTYAIVVSNAGPDPARGVVVRDAIPEGASFVSAAIEGGVATYADGVVTARLDGLASGASVVLRIVVRPTVGAGSTLVNVARVEGESVDGDPTNDVDRRETAVRASSDLAVLVTPHAPSFLQGGPAGFLLRVVNQGPAAEPDAVLTVPLPPGSTFVASSATTGAVPTLADGVLTFRLGALGVGKIVDVSVVLRPDPAFVGTLRLSGTAAGANVDAGPTDDAAAGSATIRAAADLAVYVDPPRQVHERTTFQYTLTAANLAPGAVGGVRLSAPLPAGVEFVSASSSRGDVPRFESGEVFAELGEIAGGATATLTITVRPVAGAGAVFLLSGATTADLPDPAAGNDVGRYAVTVEPAVDLDVQLRPVDSSTELGGLTTWVVNVWNASLTTATGVTLSVPYAPAGDFLGSATTQGTVRVEGGTIVANIGTIAPRGYATIAFVLRPSTIGASVLTASAVADQFDTGPDRAHSSASLQVLEPPGTFRLPTPELRVDETAGVAMIPVERVGGVRGTVTVRYRTTGGDAMPGVDYQPVSGVLTFGPGQTTTSIPVPVLAFAHNRGDRSIGVVIEGPTDGAGLGAETTTRVVVRDVDPDFTPPTVDRVSLLGDPTSIGGLAITFSEPIRPDVATDGGAYALYDLGPAGVFGDGDDAPIAYLPLGYDPASRTAYFTPAVPLPTGRHFAIIVRGAGPAGIADLAGNPLGGGVDYVGLFARGTSLQYTDSNGDAVSLQVQGGGFLDLVRSAAGEARLLTLQAAVPGRTALNGGVTKPRNGGDGVTVIDAIEGLGAFGEVRVGLKSPPFVSRGLPTTLPRGVRPAPIPQARPPRPPAIARRLPLPGR